MEKRTAAKALAKEHLSRGDPLGWFERLYASAGGDASAVPWADLRPNEHLLDWLGGRPAGGGRRALTVGCGLGDDAEELSRRGFRVTAFDISPTAIEWCGKRFAGSGVSYVIADLLNPPPEWAGAFDFVLESYTLQAMPADLRGRAVRSLARFLSPAGELLVICRGRELTEPEGDLPWPLTRDELSALTRAAGLRERTFENFFDGAEPPVRRFRATYALAGGER
jgi:SAM-dependent methyltransferase